MSLAGDALLLTGRLPGLSSHPACSQGTPTLASKTTRCSEGTSTVAMRISSQLLTPARPFSSAKCGGGLLGCAISIAAISSGTSKRAKWLSTGLTASWSSK
eukprot:CAMPEP_0185586646 /NCGR_PEP_ID=MMETSP0434-20130131/45292_1 /TAXON_ID=626734 ORGANISM="Favella taraikaensis, Strain Fe Narragansett Bay" /NCGR_SAMPLE_ID=MMETSP0434 /ASSEMBLY_ACC=CAM_ASM_000379 /LENGTH=100 /DNA_ID=CAMNT_0028207911 /DNA_START=207 /DNA_END=509 /DNA_ORIENTATION=-